MYGYGFIYDDMKVQPGVSQQSYKPSFFIRSYNVRIAYAHIYGLARDESQIHFK